ncbi:ABC transporter substrate-binding protein [Pseudooceanicola sp. C21-150M6]|uniref:ABC transporter substrate-binding protein n=1 Tax=Pseudooceanicola sp. C21-150M6 TaxID=3434355 RepID=UPI003D7FB1B6
MTASISIRATLAVALLAPVAAQADPVKIGLLFPLSGPTAQFGQNSKNGIELALEMMKERGAALADDVELVIADAPSPGDAPAAVQRMINEDGVLGVIGSFSSSITLAASELTERAEVPMITHSFADQITGRGFEYIFQVSNKATTYGAAQLDQAVAIAEAAGDTVSKIAILYEDTAYGTAQAGGLRAAAEKAGIEVVMDEAYPLGITDAAPLVNAIRRGEPDLVFPVSYLNDSLLIIRTMRQQGLSTPVIGGAAGYIIPAFKEGLGEYTEDVFSIAPTNYDLSPDIAARYEEDHGVFMAHEALMYGAAFEHLVKAISEAGTDDTAEIRDAIASLENCEGFATGLPGGCTAFDDTGLTSVATPIFVQWRGDGLVTVYPPESAKAEPIWPEAD